MLAFLLYYSIIYFRIFLIFIACTIAYRHGAFSFSLLYFLRRYKYFHGSIMYIIIIIAISLMPGCLPACLRPKIVLHYGEEFLFHFFGYTGSISNGEVENKYKANGTLNIFSFPPFVPFSHAKITQASSLRDKNRN